MTSPGRPVTAGRRGLAVAVLLAVLVLLGACRASAAPDTVRVGSSGSTEDRLLAEIYARGLQLRGVEVERAFGPGVRATSFADLRDGSFDVAPASTGDLLRLLDPRASATASPEVYAQVRERLPPTLTVLAPSAAEDKDAVVVTRAFAQQNALRSIADLAPVCARTTFGGPPEFRTRPDGLPGIQRLYGCTFASYRALDGGGAATVDALRVGAVQAAVLGTTDASIATNDLIVLEDPRGNVAAQNVVPLVRTVTSSDPRVVEVLDRISSQLDTSVLTDLNRRITGPDASDPALVARDWLSAAGIG